MSNRFNRNVVLLSLGTLIGQGGAFLFAPVIARMYAPSDFGVLAVYSAVIMLISSVSSLKYETAIPLPKEHSDGAHLLFVSLLVLVATTAVSWGVISTLGYSGSLQSHPLVVHAWMVPLGVLGAGTYQCLNYWAIRRAQFAQIAQTKATQGIGMVFTQVLLGYFKPGAAGLIIGDIIGRTSGCGSFFRAFVKDDCSELKKITRQKMLALSRQFSAFPKFSAPSALINVAGLQLPTLMFAMFFGPEIAGFFGFTQRMLALPLTLVGQSVSQVYTSEVAILASRSPDKILSLFKKLVIKLFLISLLPSAVLFLEGERIFVLFFGQSWGESGSYARIMSGMLLVQFVSFPISQTLNLIGRQRLQLMWDFSRLVIVSMSIYGCFFFKMAASTTVAAYSGAMVISYLFLLFLCHRSITVGCVRANSAENGNCPSDGEFADVLTK